LGPASVYRITLMKNGLTIHIPTPCNENWQQMAPVANGRFCQSCAKQVVDFSAMTDQQILNYLSKAPGGLCGRFADDQLQRPLQPVKPVKRKTWWVAALLPLLLVFEKSHAGKKKMWQGEPKVKTASKASPAANAMAITGPRAVFGKVVNTAGQPVPFASIMLNGQYTGVNTGEDGSFGLISPQNAAGNTLQASAVGYEGPATYLQNTTNQYMLVLTPVANNLKPVVIPSVSYAICRTTTGGAITILKLSGISLKDSIQKLFKGPAFKAYPNPVPRGSNMQVEITKPGNYALQLFDNNGKLLLVKKIDAAQSAIKTSVDIPAAIAAGTYYVRLVDETTKKQYTDKIIIM